jgi:hypothetical protein
VDHNEGTKKLILPKKRKYFMDFIEKIQKSLLPTHHQVVLNIWEFRFSSILILTNKIIYKFFIILF